MQHKNPMRFRHVAPWAVGLLTLPLQAAAAPTAGPQASITLGNSDAASCYTHDNTWSLEKEVANNTIDAATGQGAVSWQVTATKDASAAATFVVHGGLTITNTGSAPATIGNIVVNLQKPNNPKKGSNAPYVSIAADIADATLGDGASSAQIVATSSQENAATNAAWGANNYSVSGSAGTFKESAGSGTLEFRDARDNTLFALTPQRSIAVNESVTLLYDAAFQPGVLPAGTAMRVEALVSFGNAGARGGSGATGSSLDVNGNGAVDADEANVRTVPSRVILAALPATPEETNASVSLTDEVTTSGTVTYTNLANGVPATSSASGQWSVSADVSSGDEGGKLCNAASLEGSVEQEPLNVVIGYQLDANGGQVLDASGLPIPVYATYQCARPALADAGVCIDVGAPRGFQDGEFCTYTQGKYNDKAKNEVASYLSAQFSSLSFLSPGAQGKLTLGVVGPGALYDASWTQAASFRTWIGGGGPSGSLTADTLNATNTSGGTLAKQTATLTVSIALSGVMPLDPQGLGSLYYCSANDSLSGKTLSEIVGAANLALGGSGLPAGYTYSSLNDLLDNINARGFDDCKVGAFAVAHLSRTPCP